METETLSTKTINPSETAINVVNEILLRRRGNIFVSGGDNSNTTHVKAICVNIASLGYVLSPELSKSMQRLPIEELASINNFLVKSLSSMVGAGVKYRPLFRNFPDDVPDVFEYFFDRIIGHFESVLDLTENAKLLSCGHLIDTDKWDMSNFGACPICQCQITDGELLPSKERVKLKGRIKLKTIGLCSEPEIFDIFKNLVSSNTSISEQDKNDITSIFDVYRKVLEERLPDSIPNKEVLAFLCPLVIKYFGGFECLSGKVKTAVDVLRLATSMSNGDVSLSTNSHFKKFSKRDRKFLLTLLEGCKNIKEDMVRHTNKWIRLGEIVHPGDFRKRFPKSFEAFTAIRNGEKINTFNSKSEKFITSKDRTSLVEHLKSRPSELARKLDFIVSDHKDFTSSSNALKVFGSVIEQIPTTTLLQVLANFRIRATKDKGIRIIMPKGNIAKVKVLDETREKLPNALSISTNHIITDELSRRFAKLPAMGKVFIDPFLSEYVVPFSQRSASKALVTVSRGTRVVLPAEDTIRMFLYWHEGNIGRVDVDLSATMFDDEWNYKEHISYTNYEGYKCTHSGDIQSAPNGAAEFIDINKESVLKYGGRYVVMSVFSYTMQRFISMPECFAGIMGRKNPGSGEIFEPKTVKERFDVTSDGINCLPIILDLKENKMIWADITLPGARGSNNVESNLKRISLMGKALCKMADFKPNIYELLHLHAKARGKIVRSIENADEVFTPENIPVQFDRIMSEFLV